MPDREKVIKALEDFNKKRICLPHLIPWDEIADAISLLKEQDNEIDTLKTLLLGYETGAIMKEQEAEKKCCRDCEYYGACHDE